MTDHQKLCDLNFRAIDERVHDVLRSPPAVARALARNRAEADGRPEPFVNVPLARSAPVRDFANDVQDRVAAALGDSAHRKARYQPLDELHTTLAAVYPPTTVTEIAEWTRPAILETAAFEYGLAGVHLTPELVVILELRTGATQVPAMRKALEREFQHRRRRFRICSINHVTVARIWDATSAQLELLVRTLRGFGVGHLTSTRVEVTRVNITHRSRGGIEELGFDLISDGGQ